MIFQNLTRPKILGLGLTLIAVLIALQIVRVQNSEPAKALLLKLSESSDYTNRLIEPERGSIYDRWGHLLAGSEQLYDIGVALDQVQDADTVSRELAAVLGWNQSDIADMITPPKTTPEEDKPLIDLTLDNEKAGKYVTIISNVPAATINELAARMEKYKQAALNGDEMINRMVGVHYEGHLRRIYTEGELGATILGYFPFKANQIKVIVDGEEKSIPATGEGGVEEYYDSMMAGEPILVVTSNDPKEASDIPAVPPGDSLVLTIDREIQSMVERVLDEAVDSSGSAAGTAIVMDPETGEIWAMASTPRLNLNEYWEVSSIFTDETPYNRAISQTYEPGSVFKVLTMAAGLDSGTVTPDTTMYDSGYAYIGGATINNWDGIGHGEVTMTTCMQKSLNVCLVWVAQQMGAKTFYDYIKAFGIGHRTNIDLADEMIFKLALPGDTDEAGEPTWWESSLGTNSFGQGIAATPIQMITAISAVANDGNMMAPHVVKAVIQDGELREIRPMITGSPISAETAHTLTDMLEYSLQEEGSAALVEGYSIAGKTGTGSIPTKDGYTLSSTNASFVGWGPTDDPKFIVYVWLERPQTSIWGSVVAAPVFADIVKELVVLINLPPDHVRVQIR